MSKMFKIVIDAGSRSIMDKKECEISMVDFPIPSKGDAIDFSKQDCLTLFGVECEDDFSYTDVTLRTYTFDKRLSFVVMCSVDS